MAVDASLRLRLGQPGAPDDGDKRPLERRVRPRKAVKRRSEPRGTGPPDPLNRLSQCLRIDQVERVGLVDGLLELVLVASMARSMSVSFGVVTGTPCFLVAPSAVRRCTVMPRELRRRE